jgi:hypothetical protein
VLWRNSGVLKRYRNSPQSNLQFTIISSKNAIFKAA